LVQVDQVLLVLLALLVPIQSLQQSHQQVVVAVHLQTVIHLQQVVQVQAVRLYLIQPQHPPLVRVLQIKVMQVVQEWVVLQMFTVLLAVAVVLVVLVEMHQAEHQEMAARVFHHQ
jgi:hypothetical protein